jgi:tRNA (guanine-N(7)-)-methyltransferase
MWQRWLTNPTSSVEIEIGYGSSRLLSELAKRSPDTYFIGVDRNPRWFWQAKRRISKESQLPNLVYLLAEGRQFLAEHVPSSRVRRLHIYFPTPHPKVDRMFSPQFIDEVYRVLMEGGDLRIITDIRGYFDDIAALLDDVGWQYRHWTSLGISLPSGLLVGTPCELEFGSRYVLHAIKDL